MAIAEEFVENDADREQVGGDLPAGKVGVRRLVGGVPDCVRTGSPTLEAMLKSSSFAPLRVRITFAV